MDSFKDLLHTYSELLTAIGTIGTVIALGLSWIQWREARKQTQKLTKANGITETLTDRLTNISDALSTKYLGGVQEYLPQTNELIKRAVKNLRILSVSPLVGIFRQRNQRRAAVRTIEDLPQNISIECVFGSPTVRRLYREGYLKDALGNWDKWKNNPTNEEKLTNFLDDINSRKSVSNITADDLLDLLEQVSVDAIDTTYKRAVVFQVNDRPPFFLWIVDDREAIFVIRTINSELSEHAVWTSDPRLINAFVAMHQEYKSAGTKINQQGVHPAP